MNTSKITVTYEHDNTTMTYTVDNTEHITWDSMLQQHINFLRGIGYVVPEEYNVV